jgi:sec-independent protein translocase protein TatB
MDLSWAELLVVGVVALIIIGPKDLPGMFRELGRFTAKIRAMGREFSRAMEAAAKESGVNDVAKDLRAVANPKSMGLDAVRSAADKFEKWDPLKPTSAGATTPATAKAPLTPPSMPPVTAPASPAVAAGPATAALAESVAAKKAASAEKAAALKAAKAGPAAEAVVPETVAPAAKRGRVRKTPKAGAGDAE